MEFIFEKAIPEDTEHLASLVKEVWKTITHKEWFALYPQETRHYINDLFHTQKGCIWKALDNSSGQIAGMFIATYPGIASDNLGYDIEFPEFRLFQVAHMDTVIVRPHHRGYGLQQRLTLLAEQELQSEGFRYFMCTIHPDNIFSINNMRKCGYKIVKKVFKYGGLPRFILLKTISCQK